MTPLSGRFYRVVYNHDQSRVLDGVLSEEGRFHHGGEPAIYMSPSPQTAAIAVNTYLRPNDPERVTIPLFVDGANILDFRTPDAETALGLNWRDTAVRWQEQRAAGLPATSWRVSDAARAAGADGMIYPSRKKSNRWHLVLFRWNQENAPELRQDGHPLAFFRHH